MIKFIYARSLNGIIGDQGKMPWHIPEDLEVFSAKTKGHIVVMGRKTWDSLPNTFKPLPERINAVITSDTNQVQAQDLQPQVILDADALSLAIGLLQATHPDKDIWVIGGAQTFQLFMGQVEEIHETLVKLNVEGDTSLGFDPSTMNEFYSTVGPGGSTGWIESKKNGTAFRINLYQRKPVAALAPQKQPWDQ